MRRSETLLISLALLILSISLCFAKHSNSYLFGSYSYLNQKDSFGKQNNALLAAKLKELGYNITVMDTDNSDRNLADLLDILDNSGLDVFLTDKCWSNNTADSRHYALVALSTSNYQRFEAEFCGGEAVKPEDINSSVYWYGTQRAANNEHLPPRVGRAEADPEASYEHTWRLVPGRDQEGFAYTDITYRWKDQNGRAVKLSDEMRFYNTHQDRASSTDSLYITLRIKIADVTPGLRSDTVLFSFEPLGFPGRPQEFNEAVKLGLDNSASPLAKQSNTRKAPERLGARQAQTGDFTYSDYLALGSPKGYIELEYALSYNDMNLSGIFSGDLDFNPNTSDSWWWIVMRGLSPRLYWPGNCDFSLDYIEVEDQMHRNVRTQPELYRSRINQRLREFVQLPHGDIIRYCYTMDEPFQPNMDSYKMLQAMVDPDLPKPITTFYDIMHRRFAMADGKSYYDHIDLARNLIQPQTLMIDIYPVKPNVNYKPKEANFLQDVLDHQLLKSYHESKLYIESGQDRIFYPVVQAFGYWDGVNWLSWKLPPQATQKALIYLPLCYQPNGMVTYRLFGFVHEDGRGEYAPLISDPKGTPEEYHYVWDIVKEANHRAKAYGEMIQSWTWLDASTAMPKKQKTSAEAARTGISQVQVSKSGKGDYKGYIECGYYLDNSGNPAIFAVNRRTDTSLRTKKSTYQTNGKVPPQEYDSYYAMHQPQTLVVTIKKKLLGNLPALYDPLDQRLFPGKKTSIQVELEAGEGRLLQVVETLPAKLKKGKHSLNTTCVLSGKTVLKAKAELICPGDLILLPGSSLILEQGSSLEVRGKLIHMEGSALSSKGKLQLQD